MQLIKYNNNYLSIVRNFQLQQDHIHFPKSPLYHIEKAKTNNNLHCIMAFNQNKQLVSFFVLQYESEYAQHFTTENHSTIFFRAFSTDKRYLRQGYAKSCLKSLNMYIKRNYPNMHHIALVVNECNDVSYKLYKSLGFKDTGVVITKHRVKQRLLQKCLD
ncbi:GNAT family N-acetyltransferase [Staphylococcus gallinarum]|uniref:GNAT family N-acetyltransferase n=1 Tax=Staphylococcus gallinarum TaxID=1293 RepID=UPI000E69359F|nr:GNAT family N-acetyltransferase [Staphylococcus gallinarum]MCD8786409.1 GNAT family N-acetyltransferase [Staphylococcus gallinarum]MCD8858625.1 GNAT family N-acetyltransferase [Staphylococcus gallinarum]RIO76722.1 GNAT family N-acetyltransferase [Staphylococcus gallinarum]